MFFDLTARPKKRRASKSKGKKGGRARTKTYRGVKRATSRSKKARSKSGY